MTILGRALADGNEDIWRARDCLTTAGYDARRNQEGKNRAFFEIVARKRRESVHRMPNRPVSVIQATRRTFGGFMDHASSHNAFNVLFTLAFFAAFALMIVRFG